MKIAIVIYDDFSLLNLAKLSNFLNKFDNLNIKICAFKNEIKSKFGICIKPDIFNESLDGFDCVMVCDGDIDKMVSNDIFLSWIRSSCLAKYKISFGNAYEILKASKFENFTNFADFNKNNIENLLHLK